MNKTNTIEAILRSFRKDFVNDHGGEERFLRGLFVEDFKAFLSQALRQAHEDGYNECRQFFETEKNILIADMEKK